MTYRHVQVGLGYTLTAEALEEAAKALAEAVNGGCWVADYTDAQKEVWRKRLKRGFTGA